MTGTIAARDRPRHRLTVRGIGPGARPLRSDGAPATAHRQVRQRLVGQPPVRTSVPSVLAEERQRPEELRGGHR